MSNHNWRVLFLVVLFVHRPMDFQQENQNGGDNKENQEGGDNKEPATDPSASAVKLYLQDKNERSIGECAGVFIDKNWIVSSATCLRKACNDNMLKICADSEPPVNGTSCTLAFSAEKMIILGHSWYNDLAYIYSAQEFSEATQMREISCLVPKPQSFSRTSPSHMAKCTVIGFMKSNNGSDVRTAVPVARHGPCKKGYICIDDESGSTCDLDLGSPLVCDGVVWGIMQSHHPTSCAFALFMDLESYGKVTDKILQGTFAAENATCSKGFQFESFSQCVIAAFLILLMKI